MTVITVDSGGFNLCSNGSFVANLTGQTGSSTTTVCEFSVTLTVTTQTVTLTAPGPYLIQGCTWTAITPLSGQGTISQGAVGATKLTGRATTKCQGGTFTNDVTGSFRAQRSALTTAPAITQAPTDQLPVGGRATFTCKASGTPTPSYAWQRLPVGSATWTGISLGGPYNYFDDTITATLIVTGPTTAMSGDQFRCVATNSSGSATSGAARLTVPASIAPAITLHPADQTVAEGTTATFTCAASGTPTPTYQWQWDPFGDSFIWVDLTDNNIYTGSATASLSVDALAIDTGTNYRCVATNVGGVARSRGGALTVTAPVAPKITMNPANANAAAGLPATFACAASGTAPTYKWQRLPAGSATWTNPSNAGAYSGVTTTTLSVAATTLAMSGDQFRCVATNATGTATSGAALLTVTPSAAPVITKHPVNQSATAGGTGTFTVAATGNPAPVYQWQRLPVGSTAWSNIADGADPAAGAPAASAPSDTTYSGAKTASLSVTSAGAAMHGDQFRAVASNGVKPDATSNGATLTINVPPHFTKHPADKFMTKADTSRVATFAVTATGRPTPAYTWQRRAATSLSWSTLPDGGSYSGTSTSVLTVSNTTAAMSGDQFRAVASNGIQPDATSTAATLTFFSLTVVDPACHLAESGEICTGKSFLTKISSTRVQLREDVALLATANVVRTGVATDGVTRLLLRVPSDKPVTFSMTDQFGATAGPTWGTLLDRFGRSLGSRAVDPEDTGQGLMAFAVYQSPIDPPLPGGPVRLTIAAQSASSPSAENVTLTLQTPPTVFVHGIWSSGAAWAGLGAYLRRFGYPVCDQCFVNYGNVDGGAASFDPKVNGPAFARLTDGRLQALSSVRGQGIAASQVDVVAHSMGGLLTRARVAQPDYRSLANYQQGEFHKIITAGTPHFGTPLADWLIDHSRCTKRISVTEYVESETGRVKTPRTTVKDETLDDYFTAYEVFDFKHAFGPLGPGAYGLQTSGPDIDHLGLTAVPAHALVGLDAGSASWVERLVFNKIFARYNPDPSKPAPTVHLLLDRGGDNGAHDTLVPVQSQMGGLTNQQVTYFPATVHGHDSIDTSETDSTAIFSEVLHLLRDATIASDEFGNFSARPANWWSSSRSHVSQPPPCPAHDAHALSPPAAAADVVSLTPVAGTVVHPGDNLPIVFNADMDASALLTIGSDQYAIPGVGFLLSYTIPTDRAGRLDIAVDTFGSGTQDYRATTYVMVVPANSPTSIAVSPTSASLIAVDGQVQLRVTGAYGGGAQIDLTAGSAGTTYTVSSGGSGVIQVTADGLVQAIDSGSAIVTAANAGRTAVINVTVAVSNHAPVLNAAGTAKVAAGSSLAVSLSATDVDGNALALVGVDLPSFASVVDNGDGTGQLRLRPVGNGDLGTFPVTVTAFDDGDPPLHTNRTVQVTVDAGTLSVSPSQLNFSGTNTNGVLGPITGSQPVTVTGGGTWSATASQPWVRLTPSTGVGSGTFSVTITNPNNVLVNSTGVTQLARITVTSTNVTNSPRSIDVYLSLRPASGNAAPFGQVDTPAQNTAGIQGAIGVTGWSLDDVGVAGVKIYRNCLSFDAPANCQVILGNRVVSVGDAVFLAGARPDVETAFSTLPQAPRAGWGYLMLTNMLPQVPNGLGFGGQGPLTLYAFATDVEGNVTLLGRSQGDHTPTSITMGNDTIVTPFGAIDTPGQGETVSGTIANFGWVLTPDSNTTADSTDILIPVNGSTMKVFIDGVAIGSVAYNQCRGNVGNPVPATSFCNDDVASIFGNTTPQAALATRATNVTRYRNLDAGRAAIGAYTIDTTALANGAHSIAWSVTDSAGRSEGIGSRNFNVLNSGADRQVAAAAPVTEGATAVPGEVVSLVVVAPGKVVWGRTGFDLAAAFTVLAADAEGIRRVRLPELGRIELQLGHVAAGYLIANGVFRDLPAGSHLNPRTGEFTWTPAPGYFGTYRLAFIVGNDQTIVEVTIEPVSP